MHILVTRPEADAAALKLPLEAMGHRVSLAPMMTISFEGAEQIDLSSCTALIATSRNGLRGLEHQLAKLTPNMFNVPLYAVGPGTASLAKSLGFMKVIEGPATAADLVPLLVRDLQPSKDVIVHVAGDTLAFDLKEALTPLGFCFHQPVVYRSVPASQLPSGVAQDLAEGRIDAVVLMSPRTAQTFVNLVINQGLALTARKTSYICLSAAVSGQLDALQPVRTEVALKPNLEETVGAVRRLTEQFR
jgi:uroporphyrinogen-III synthase